MPEAANLTLIFWKCDVTSSQLGGDYMQCYCSPWKVKTVLSRYPCIRICQEGKVIK